MDNDVIGTIVLVRSQKILPYLPYHVDILSDCPGWFRFELISPLAVVGDHVECLAKPCEETEEVNGIYRFLYVLIDRDDWSNDDPLEQIAYTEEPDGVESVKQ